jgi:predicted AAA+ superfamily ATPase
MSNTLAKDIIVRLLQSQNTIKREFGNLEKITDNYPKMVISMDDIGVNSRDGIKHVRFRDFLHSKIPQ